MLLEVKQMISSSLIVTDLTYNLPQRQYGKTKYFTFSKHRITKAIELL